jgi:hypothetical protein
MRIATRKILVLLVFFELGLVTGADAEDAARDDSRQPEQIARTVEGNPPIDQTVEGSPAVSPANPGSYTIRNDLLTGPSLLANTAREPAAADGWMAPTHPSDLADPAHDELGSLDDEVEVQVDPNEPKSIELSQGVRGKLRAKSSGALLGIAIGFW